MQNTFLETKVLWSQIDANGHLRHSVYADFAAQARVEMLETLGMTMEWMQRERIGPILFREELIYKREIRPADVVIVTCYLHSCRADGSRWSFMQELFRKNDRQLCAIVNVDGAWIDMNSRKLTIPPPDFSRFLLEQVPKTKDFVITGSA